MNEDTETEYQPGAIHCPDCDGDTIDAGGIEICAECGADCSDCSPD